MKNLAWHFEELKNTYIKGTIGVTLNNPPFKKGDMPDLQQYPRNINLTEKQ